MTALTLTCDMNYSITALFSDRLLHLLTNQNRVFHITVIERLVNYDVHTDIFDLKGLEVCFFLVLKTFTLAISEELKLLYFTHKTGLVQY